MTSVSKLSENMVQVSQYSVSTTHPQLYSISKRWRLLLTNVASLKKWL